MTRRGHFLSVALGVSAVLAFAPNLPAQDVITTDARNHVVSPNGRLVAFSKGGQIFVRNRATGMTTFVTAGRFPSLSANGRFVAFSRERADASGFQGPVLDVFVHDRQAGTTELINVSVTPGEDANETSADHDSGPRISPDGRYVVFHSFATNLVPGDTSFSPADIFVRDRTTQSTTRIGQGTFPAISADGPVVVFDGTIPQCTNRIIAHNIATGSSLCVDLAPGGAPADGGSLKPAISADGCVVAFTSDATNLLGPGADTNRVPDVFVRDLCRGGLTRVSVGNGVPGAQADGGSDNPEVSADGRFVVFDSVATNLVPGTPVVGRRVYVRDRLAGTTTLFSDDALPTNWRPSISANGSVVVFDSTDSILVEDPGVIRQPPCLSGGCSETFPVGDVVSSILAAGPNVIYAGPASPGTGVVSGFDATVRPTLLNRPPYPGFTGAVRIAIGDVDGDGAPDIITSPGPGGGPHVRVFAGSTADRVLLDFFAYSPLFTGGVFVAAGDIDGDGKAEVITAAGQGGGPHVRVWKFIVAGAPPVEIAGFFAFTPVFTGGVSVAAGNVDGSGNAEIVTGAGPGGGPHVIVWRFVGGGVVPFASFFPYHPSFLGGVNVAVGDLIGSGQAQVITGAGPGGGPHVQSFRFESDGTPVVQASFFAYVPGFSGGVNVAVADTKSDGKGKIVTGPGPGGGPHVRVIEVEQPQASNETFATVVEGELLVAEPTDTSGVNVGGDPPGGAGDSF